MKRLILAAMVMTMAAPRALAGPSEVTGPGEVTAVSVLPGPGRAQVIIDVTGTVSVQDFTLDNPARLVVDITTATLRAPGTRYDGKNRGGILDIRYSQLRPDVVRVVINLESLKDYQIEHSDVAIRITFGSDQSFGPWSTASFVGRVSPVEVADALPETRTMFAPATSGMPQSQQPRVTVTYDQANLHDVANAFAEFSGKSIILGQNIDAVINATIKNQPWDVAFQIILEAHGLTATEDPPGILRVDSRTSLAARDSTEQLMTVVKSVNYARATALAVSLASVVSSRGKIIADTGTNSLIITDVVSRIDADTALVNQLDVRTPQVSIQAKLIFVDRSDIEDLGIKYDLGTSDQFFNRLVQRPDPATTEAVDTDGDGVPDAVRATGSFDRDINVVDLGGNALAGIANANAEVASPALQLIFSTAIGSFNLTSFVDALQRVELADLQAEPLTTTADNTEAYILVGERTPIRQIDASSQGGGAGTGTPRAVTTIVPTGLQLRVTPHVTNNRQILMQVFVENSSVRAAPADVGFTFQTQEVSAQILVEDGETAVIGGLTVTEITVAKSGIPFLVDLPVVGGLFGFTTRREQRRDLLILVTPHILDQPSR